MVTLCPVDSHKLMKFIRIKQNRLKLDLELRHSPKRKYFSPAMFCLYTEVIPRLQSHASGRLLDAGCGTMPFQSYLENVIDEYQSLDIENRVPGVDFLADLQDMGILTAASYDTVLCSEVLEHVQRPDKVLAELRRILKPRGKLILTVPYLSRLHEEPFDYFRYTKYGLQFLLEQSGFRVLELVPTGSLFSFLGHQISTVVVCSLWHVPVLKHCVFWLNACLCTFPCYWFDRLLGIAQKLPLGYVAVAEKYTSG